jgi:hypothetical protein
VSTRNLTRAQLFEILRSGEALSRADIRELHCIQPIANVRSILEFGILSHVGAESIPHVSIAMEEIQDRRAIVDIPGTGRRLHEFAVVYVYGRNKMMSKLTFTRDHRDLCVLRVGLDLLDRDGVLIASENASTDRVRFASAPDGLGILKKELVLARSWNHDDEIAKKRHGALMCAEVLVPDRVDPQYIRGAYVSCRAAADTLRADVPDDFPITINRDLFFQ